MSSAEVPQQGALAQCAGAEGGGLVQLEEMALEKQQPPSAYEDIQQDRGTFFTVVHIGRAVSINCNQGWDWIWGKYFFTIKAFEIKQGNRMSKEVMQSQFLEIFNTWLDKARSNLVCYFTDPILRKRFHIRLSNVPSTLNDLMILKLSACSTIHRFKNWSIWSRWTHSDTNHTVPCMSFKLC